LSYAPGRELLRMRRNAGLVHPNPV